MSAILHPSCPYFHVNCDYDNCVTLFPLASCSAGSDNCKSCKSGESKCETCDQGYTVDANGVCQGILFVYTVLLPQTTTTYITVLVQFTYCAKKLVS